MDDAQLILVRFLIGFVINLVFGIIAFTREMLDDTGFFTGVILFTFTYVFLDWQAYAIIIMFFVITGMAIDIENRDKAEKGEFELYKAKRTMGRVLGRSLAGAVFAGLFFFTGRPEYKLAFVASYAESAFDTVSTKLGMLLSKDAVLVTNLKPVHRGTPGGMSFQGTSCGLLAALVVGAVGFFTGLIAGWEFLIVSAAALLGSCVDGVLNAVFFRRNKHVPNEFINFFGSITAGIAAVLILGLCYAMFGQAFMPERGGLWQMKSKI